MMHTSVLTWTSIHIACWTKHTNKQTNKQIKHVWQEVLSSSSACKMMSNVLDWCRVTPSPSPTSSPLSPLPSRLSPLPTPLAPRPSPLAPRPSPLAPRPSPLAPRPSPLFPLPSPLSPLPSPLSPPRLLLRYLWRSENLACGFKRHSSAWALYGYCIVWVSCLGQRWK